MLLLNVPYIEKDKAKKLGAKWSPELKKWYVKNKEDYYKFISWIEPYGNIVVIDALYLIEGIQKCFRCGKETRVIGFGIDKHFSIDKMYELQENYNENIKDALEEINQNDIHIVGPITPIPEVLMEYIKSKYNYKLRYSKTTKTSNISNCCEYCDVLQGDFFLFNEVDSPFFIHSPEDVKKLKIYKIRLKHDLIINAEDGWASFDEMFKKYGHIISLDINLS
ncbi:hypothetical protein B7939_07115 [Eggerthia catenaformis]|uniref:DUF5710 domain-containing protein n=1 Tax=Eggerthia catenaformis TaxID=31973 RepID=UPI000478C9C5|nr:DUF5710 domain-containing protein [Eggerthia catenaformis]OUC51327.1 hypothetical protein B7939_07115 [Eggerthia catenaformis]